MPLACVRAHRLFKEHELESKLILSVHDSIVCDVSPKETDIVIQVLSEAMRGVVDEAYERWGYKFTLPLDIEIAVGNNWMEVAEIQLD